MAGPPPRHWVTAVLLPTLLLAVVALPVVSTVAGAEALAASRAPLWQKQWRPAGGDGFGGAHLARAGTGDLYVAGPLYRLASSQVDWAVARFTAAGTRKWVRTLAGPYNGNDALSAVAADAAGNVVAVGQVATGSLSTQSDWMVAKWNRAGKLLWKRQTDGSGHGYDLAKDVVAGADGSFYVVGQMDRVGESDDGVIVKYSALGKTLWSRYIDAPEPGSDKLNAVALDAKGNAYVTGHDYDGSRAHDVVLARYSPSGHTDWFRRWGDQTALNHDQGSSIAVRGSVVAIAGVSWTIFPPNVWVDRGLALKYTTSGVLKWSRIRANDSPSLRAAWDLVGVDGSGRVAVAGPRVTSAGVPTPLSWVTTVYSSSGTAGVVQQLQGALDYYNLAADLDSTAGGGVYETGSLGSATKGRDLSVVAMRAGGTLAWTSRPTLSGGSAGGGIVATSTAVYVAGNAGSSMILLKYRP